MDRHNAMLPKRRHGYRPCLFLAPKPGSYQGRRRREPSEHDGLGLRLQYLDKPRLPHNLRLRAANGAPRGTPRDPGFRGGSCQEIGGGPAGGAGRSRQTDGVLEDVRTLLRAANDTRSN